MSPLQISVPHFLFDLRDPVPCSSRPHLFHPSDDNSRINDQSQQSKIARARALCARCPVSTECRDWARKSGECGTWGGETDAERNASGYPCQAHGTEAQRRRFKSSRNKS
ncbi:WhiB family transcriptional regulator [Streptomyces sp. NPDC095817]|uniref:WhiB family transcriptional regulator n=1 Tax=Streptomyces sp. NPDC095817 TaxID=3155082 RepID=UPI003329CCE8